MGLIEELPERLTGEADSRIVTISAIADQFIRTRGAGKAAASITIYRKAKQNLIDCFGDVDICTLKVKDGREFWRWLIEEGNSKVDKSAGEVKGLMPNTAKQRLRDALAFFAMAIEDELITKNPFKAQGLSTSQTAAQKAYVTWSQIEKVIEHCPTDEWKLLFALVRSIPTRIPSELEELTWSDVDWEANTILIHSPKTRDIGKFARLVPIFDTLKPYLETMFFKPDTELYIFPTLRLNTNPGTSAKKIVTKSKQELWPNFFNSLRASTLTDLMDQHGLRKACKWAGNSAAVAMKCYALTRSDDFDDNGEKRQEASIKSDAILPADAKSDAIPASTTEQKPNKKRTAENQRSLQCVLVDDIGLEPTTSSMSTRCNCLFPR